MLKSIGITLLVTMVFTTPALAGEISRKQYVVLRSGPRPASDNAILFFPCYPSQLKRGDCTKVKKEFSTLVSTLEVQMEREEQEERNYCTNTNACLSKVTHLEIYAIWNSSIEKAREVFSSLGIPSSTRTDFDGNFSFDCPTETCFVYSAALVGRTSSQWIDILSTGKSDLSGSKAFTVNIPDSL